MLDGPAAGERRFRLSQSLALPPALSFAGALPLYGEGHGQVSFRLPGGRLMRARALLRHDPEQPERGSEARLLDLTEEELAALETYTTELERG